MEDSYMSRIKVKFIQVVGPKGSDQNSGRAIITLDLNGHAVICDDSHVSEIDHLANQYGPGTMPSHGQACPITGGRLRLPGAFLGDESHHMYVTITGGEIYFDQLGWYRDGWIELEMDILSLENSRGKRNTSREDDDPYAEVRAQHAARQRTQFTRISSRERRDWGFRPTSSVPKKKS